MKLHELSVAQVEELQCDIFYGDETPRLFKHLENINCPLDIPFDVLEKYYKNYNFTADDFPLLSEAEGGTLTE